MNLGKRFISSIWSGIRCRLRRKEKRYIGTKPYELYERLPDWYTLYVEFTNRTTWHGLKYPCLPSRFRIRKIIWSILLLGNAALFLYIMSLNMDNLFSYPTNVNVEVDYIDTVPFPAITICNQNLYRLTAMQENGLYDFLVNEFGNSSTQDYCDDFQLYPGICRIPDSFYAVSDVTGTGSVVVYGEMTRSACASLCVFVNNVTCSGFLYDRWTRTCQISPYTGEWVENGEQVVTQCNSSTPVEFYRRIRCDMNLTIQCDFEDSSCLLVNDTSQKDQWMVVEAQGHPVLRDNTLNLDSGHILNLLLTDRRPGYTARLISPYVNTTGRCLELFYWLQLDEAGNSEYPTLYVIQVTEERDEVLVSTTTNGPADWSRLFVELESGFNQVVIQGMRGSVGMSGISVDDITIMDCAYFSSHRECKVNRLGRGYMGTQSVSADGHQCLSWDSIRSPLVARLPDPSPKAAGSYCRNIPMENWNSPSCFVELPSGNIQLSACDIPYCDCLNASYFRCDNGMCLPPNLLCNGINECLDNSDELRACGRKRTVECKFDDDYKCGYTTTSIGNQRWTRLSSSALSYYNGDLLRPTVSALEQLMVIDSKLGQSGNQVQLISPLWYFNRPTLVELTYIMMTSAPSETIAGFYVFQLSDLHSPVRRLFNATSFANTNLQKSSMCVPSGTYHLMFLGVQGVPYETVYGLDIVAFKGTCNATFETTDEPFNCSFVSFCGYRFLSSSSLFTRTLTNIQNAFETNNPTVTDECSSVLNGLQGTILSPGYPDNYPDNLFSCEYLIVQPNGTTVNITFVEFSIEPENDCLSDRLEITDVVYGNTRIYCGRSIPPVFQSKGSRVRIVFKTDDSVNNGLFRLTYTTRFYSPNADDYTAVMTYSGPAPPNFYSHWARLISPPVALTTNSCLSIIIAANANITILTSFLNDVGIYSERRLFSSALPLGEAWHRLRLNIAPSVPNQTLAAVIETAISEVGIVATAVAEVRLYAGICRLLVMNGSLECDFADAEQCGYLDESPGSVNWARVYSKISNQFYMRAVFTESSYDEAVLTSITVTTNSSKCLRLSLYSTSASAYISISLQMAGQKGSSSSDNQANERYRLPAGPAPINYDLPVGTYSVVMKVSYPVEILEASAKSFDEVRIYGTIVTDGECQISAYKISVTCSFEDVFACEYQPLSGFGNQWNWVNFQTLLELDMRQDGEILNTSLAQGNVMLFNGSSVNSLKGVLTSPATTVAPPGQRMTLSVYASSNRSTSLEIYMTSSLDHVSRRLLATSDLLDNDWQMLSLYLPSGSYKIVFVAYTTPGNYVAVDDVAVANASYSAPETDTSDDDCWDVNIMNCPSSQFTWSPQVAWSNVSDIRNDTIHPAGNECVYVFYAFEGEFSYNESVKTSSNGSDCDIYIRGIGQFTTSLSFIDSVLNCSRQRVQVWRYINGQLMNDGKCWCSALVGSGLVPLNFTTEDILQIHVSAIEGNPRFTMNYSYVPNDMTGYPLALYYNVTEQTDDVTMSRMAEWASPIIPTRQNDTICLSVELALTQSSSVEVILLERQALSTQVTQTVVLATSGERGDPWRRGIFDIALQAQTSRAQLVFYFSMTNATFDPTTAGKAFVAAIRNVDIYKGACNSTDCGSSSFGRCYFSSNSSCGFVDTSVNSSRWIIAAERALLETSGSCKVTFDNDYSYTGNVSNTISGRLCQGWGSQSPHPHHQDVADYFPDASLNETANFCRNPSNPFIARTAWCYTTDEAQRREYCDIPQCLDHFMRVEFPSRITSRAILTSPTFVVSDVTCLRFSYSLTSTRVQLTVYVTSAIGEDIEKSYVILSEPTAVTWLSGEVELTPTASQVVFYADKTDVTDTSVFVSIDNVTMTTGPCQVADEGNSSHLNTRVPYLGPRLGADEYKQFVLADNKGVDMRNVTSLLAHQIENLLLSCDYVVDDCLGWDSFATEFTDMGQCYTFNYNASNSFQTNATGSKSGLRLTLNIEQYEHVPEFGFGVGAKIYLHDQVEIPSMKDLGLSIPTAMHTLVSTSYTKTENMLPPYGTCGSANLSYFGSNLTDDDYTQSKCLMQDKTAYYNAVCGCKDIYMPGPFDVCSLDSYFGCVYETIQDQMVPYKSICPQACVTNIYSVQMSQAQLPGLDVKKLYAIQTPGIQSGYLNALEIRARIDESLITQTLTQLQAAIDNLILLRGYIYFAALDPATSIPGHVDAAIQTSAQLISNEIVRDGGSLMLPFVQRYTTHLKPSVTYLVASVRSIYGQLSFARDVLSSVGSTGWSRSLAWYQGFLNETWTCLTRMNDTLVVFAPNINPNDSYLPKLFDHPTCNDSMNTLIQSVNQLINDFPQLTVTFTGNQSNASNTAKLFAGIDETLSVLLTVENCSIQYEKLLTDFRLWLDQLEFTAKDTGQAKADDILVAFNDIDSWLVELRDNYSMNVIQKKDLATILLSDQTTDAVQRIDNMIQDIIQQVVTPMQNRIDADEYTASSSYLQFLMFLARMYNFTHNDVIDDAARQLLIWREPVHNLEVPETIEYLLSEDEVWQIWPTDQDLESFVASSAPSRLDLVCLQFSDPLHRQLSFFLSEVSNRQSQLSLAINVLLQTLKSYLDSTALDETFAMKNFLVIDIYYGELKFEHITQSGAYGWQNFFSDMGSFFGLLMGCSILTMIEVIDLVVYYSIVKFIERYEERPLRQEVIDIKI